VLHQWSAVHRTESVTVKQVIEKATDFYSESGILDFNKRRFIYPNFRKALLVVAGDGGTINSRRLGTWLGRRKGQVVGICGLRPQRLRTARTAGGQRHRNSECREYQWTFFIPTWETVRHAECAKFVIADK
jgi:putative DNA primase/helicase